MKLNLQKGETSVSSFLHLLHSLTKLQGKRHSQMEWNFENTWVLYVFGLRDLLHDCDGMAYYITTHYFTALLPQNFPPKTNSTGTDINVIVIRLKLSLRVI